MPWGAAIAAGASLIGGKLASDANSDAAATAGNASIRAAEINAESVDKQIEELRRQFDVSNERLDEARTGALSRLGAGAQGADDRYAAITTGSAAAPAYMRSVMADPGRLTAIQAENLDELRRSVNNQIRGSSFAGSGRTAAALLRNVESDYVNRALEANRDRSDRAAAGLSDVYFNSEGARAQNAYDQAKSEANVELGIGTSLASNATNLGTQVGNAYANQGAANAAGVNAAGQYAAGSQAANGNIWGSTIGDIGSIIAAENRRSKYGGSSWGDFTKKNGG